MLTSVSNFQILGKPLNMYLGILTLTSFILTALISILNQKGIHKIPFKWHSRFAKIAIFLALIHGTLGILTYL